MDIEKWRDIADEFTEGLVLGNGASIAIDQSFSYSSLLESAKEKGLITSNVNKVFKAAETRDFELVLRMLRHASQVNTALGIEEEKTTNAHEELRNALVQVVQETHVAYEEVENILPTIAGFLKRFKKVVSLNYDLLVYWAMLIGNDQFGPNWFKDCFLHGEFETAGYLEEPYGYTEGCTLVFYPHGNLVLAKNMDDDEERKIVKEEDSKLLRTVISKWESEPYLPLFVGEGSSNEKLRAIRRSEYLSFVYENILKHLGSKIAIFGWSMRDQDDHILRALCKEHVEVFAISAHMSSPTVEETRRKMKQKIDRFSSNLAVKVIFFDSESEGCWIKS